MLKQANEREKFLVVVDIFPPLSTVIIGNEY